MTAAREPFSRALFFDPGDLGALYHLVRIAARDGNRSELDSLAARFYQLSPAGDRTLELRALQAYTTHDSAGVDSVVAEFGRAPDGILPLAVWSVAVFAQNIPGAERIARLLTEPGAAARCAGAGAHPAGASRAGSRAEERGVERAGGSRQAGQCRAPSGRCLVQGAPVRPPVPGGARCRQIATRAVGRRGSPPRGVRGPARSTAGTTACTRS